MLIVILVSLSFFLTDTDGRHLRQKTVFQANGGTVENRRNAIATREAAQTREERNEICQKLKEDWGAILDSWPCCQNVEKGISIWNGHDITPETLDLGYPHCLENGKYAPHQCTDTDFDPNWFPKLSCFCVNEYGKIYDDQSLFDPNCNPYPEK